MKRNRIPTILQWVFTILEGLMVLFGILMLFVVAVIALNEPDKSRESPNSMGMGISLGSVRIEIPEEIYSISIDSIDVEEIGIQRIRGDVNVRGLNNLGDYIDMTLIGSSLAGFVVILGSAIVFEFSRRLFKNVSQGRAFENSNILNVHKIGVMVIVFSIAGSSMESWVKYRQATFLQQNVAIEGLILDFRPMDSGEGIHINGGPKSDEFNALVGGSALEFSKGNFYFAVPIGGIFMGLLILGAGEAFRQGLILQEENALTV